MKNLELVIQKEELKKKLDIFPPDSAEDVRNKLELLEGEERLDKSAIKGLDQIDYWIKKWDKGFWGNGLGGTGGGGGSGTVQSVVGGTNISVDNTDPANPIVNWASPNWFPNKESVEIGETLLIPSNYQLVMNEQLIDNGGDIILDGDLYIDNYIPDATQTVASSLIVTTNTTLTATNGFYFRGVDCTAGNVTITLPSVAGNTAMFAIKKIDSSANTVTVQGTGGDTVENGVSQVLTSQYDLVTYVPNSTGWFSGL